MVLRGKMGWPLIYIMCFIPIVLWYLAMPLSDRFLDTSSTFTSIGQVLGLVGMVLFSISMILSTRLSVFEDLFDGTNHVYIVHHLIGKTSLILLLLHPLAISLRYLSMSFVMVFQFFLPGEDWANNFGIASLLFMLTLLIITLYIELPYQVWRFTHKFLGLAFLLGGIHGVLITSDISRFPILHIYMLLVIGLGLAGYLWRTILGRWLVPRFHYTVYGMSPVNNSTIELILTPESDKKIDFIPGQFIFVSFRAKGISHEPHPFSISSAPTPDGFALLIKALGDDTKRYSEIPVGTKVDVEGPYGRFSYRYNVNMNQIWIAGGIGITPFLSMARTLGPDPVSIDLYYTVHDEKEAVYLQELQEIMGRVSGFRIIPWYTNGNGRLTADIIAKMSGDIHLRDAFICGPPAMMRAMKIQLRNIGVPQTRIHSEEFGMV